MKRGLKNIDQKQVMHNYMKRNILLGSFSLLLIVFMSIGYSILSTDLNIGTNVNVGGIGNAIKINSVTSFTSVNGGYEVYDRKFSVTTATFNIGLPSLDSSISYDVSIINKSGKTMELKDVINSSYSNLDIVYSFNGLHIGDIIADGESVKFTITFTYKHGLTSVPTNNELGIVFDFNFEEYVQSELAYAKGNMLLNLEGTTPINNNTWIDSQSSLALNLINGVTYDENNRLYNFASGYGTFNKAIIPATGDFTLEVYIKTPSTLLNDDEAIIAQISDTSNDTGRFKLNLYAENSASNNYLRLFSNTTRTNVMYSFNNKVDPSTQYLMQVVRTGEVVNLYLNGILISQDNNFTSATKISQGPFKVARWNNSNNQHYVGGIYAIRLYDRVLTSDELMNNYLVDVNEYTPSVSRDHILLTYALDNQIITSGSGLYDMTNNEYRYKGRYPDNYIKFEGDDKLYRILSYNSDNTAKIVLFNTEYNQPFDASGNRNKTNSTYCVNSETVAGDTIDGTVFNSCNSFEARDLVSTKYSKGNVGNDSTILTFVNSTFYDSLADNIKNKIIPHNFYTGIALGAVNYSEFIKEIKNSTWYGNIGLMDAYDVFESSYTPVTYVSDGAVSVEDSWIIESTDESTVYWTSNGSASNAFDVWTVYIGKYFGKKRASRLSQLNSNVVMKMYAAPTFYIDSTVTVKGSGAINDPFIINKVQ